MLSRITEAVTPMTHHPSPIFDTGFPYFWHRAPEGLGACATIY